MQAPEMSAAPGRRWCGHGPRGSCLCPPWVGQHSLACLLRWPTPHQLLGGPRPGAHVPAGGPSAGPRTPAGGAGSLRGDLSSRFTPAAPRAPWPQPLCHKALGAAARGPRSLPPPSLTHSTKGQLPRVPSSLKPRSSRVEQGAQAPDTPGSASETADLGRGGWERASAGGCGGHAPSLHGVHQPPGAPRPGLPPGVVEMVLGCLSLPGRGQGHHKASRCGQERTCPECAGLGGAGGLRTANLAPGPSADVPGSWG